ncbi:MAG: YdcF family protein, partial [Candidatus Entotheonellia bacterium]
SALHLPRAVSLFRKEGFHVIPAPCDYAVSSDPLVLTDFLPSGGTLSSTGSAVHEYVGIAIYWVIGRL